MTKENHLIKVEEGVAPATYLLYVEKNGSFYRRTTAMEVHGGVVLHTSNYYNPEFITKGLLRAPADTSVYLPGSKIIYDPKSDTVMLNHPKETNAPQTGQVADGL